MFTQLNTHTLGLAGSLCNDEQNKPRPFRFPHCYGVVDTAAALDNRQLSSSQVSIEVVNTLIQVQWDWCRTKPNMVHNNRTEHRSVVSCLYHSEEKFVLLIYRINSGALHLNLGLPLG